MIRRELLYLAGAARAWAQTQTDLKSQRETVQGTIVSVVDFVPLSVTFLPRQLAIISQTAPPACHVSPFPARRRKARHRQSTRRR